MTGGVLIPPKERVGGPDEIAAYFESQLEQAEAGSEPGDESKREAVGE